MNDYEKKFIHELYVINKLTRSYCAPNKNDRCHKMRVFVFVVFNNVSLDVRLSFRCDLIYKCYYLVYKCYYLVYMCYYLVTHQ